VRHYTLGAWGRGADGIYTAPVYEGGSNDCVAWARIEQAPHETLVLWKVSMKLVDSSGDAKSALKDTVVKAKGQAERWVEEMAA
jgi:hypothetical protein